MYINVSSDIVDNIEFILAICTDTAVSYVNMK